MIDEHVIDANVFISANTDHYGMTFCPAFWDWLVEARGANRLFSIRAVLDELCCQQDEVSTWAQADGKCLFLDDDQKMIDKLGAVSAWVNGQSYEPAAVSGFLSSGADYYLIAHALAHGRTLVTHEKAANSRKKIKIPDVCYGLKIKCITPFDMIRACGPKFVLER